MYHISEEIGLCSSSSPTCANVSSPPLFTISRRPYTSEILKTSSHRSKCIILDGFFTTYLTILISPFFTWPTFNADVMSPYFAINSRIAIIPIYSSVSAYLSRSRKNIFNERFHVNWYSFRISWRRFAAFNDLTLQT